MAEDGTASREVQFPEGFLWGAATSAHQVEGGNRNDWAEWEHANAERLAREAEQEFGSLPNWSAIKTQAQDRSNYISGRATDHYHRFREDFDIAKRLGHNAHRFSIEWSRIEPEEGKFNEQEIAHYREVIRVLKERGMEPFVTLWHWTIPVWLARSSGVWRNDFPDLFARYATRIAEALPAVRFWITLNEPEIYALNGYLRGVWPPGRRGLVSFLRTTYRLNLAHQQAYGRLKALNSHSSVGVAVNQVYFESGGGPLNGMLSWLAERFWNFRFLWHITRELDFIGVNYYFHNRVDYGFNRNANRELSDLGWEVFPEGIFHVLTALRRFEKPIYIIENGIADADDDDRARFIREHLRWVARAIGEGIDVRGYFYWSLLDNFEWDKGFWPRFGLVEVDYKALTRTIRPSAWEYTGIIGAGADRARFSGS